MFNFKQFLQRKNPETLKTLLSKEEFLRFDVMKKEMILEKAKKELADFLKKRKK